MIEPCCIAGHNGEEVVVSFYLGGAEVKVWMPAPAAVALATDLQYAARQLEEGNVQVRLFAGDVGKEGPCGAD